jgi:hypothetical protein
MYFNVGIINMHRSLNVRGAMLSTATMSTEVQLSFNSLYSVSLQESSLEDADEEEKLLF